MLGVGPGHWSGTMLHHLTLVTHYQAWSPRCKWSLAHFAQFLRSRERQRENVSDQECLSEESAESVFILVVEFLRLHR